MSPGQKFGRFQIVRLLARGMTDVYLADYPTRHGRAVLKVIEDPAASPHAVAAETRGACIQQQLRRRNPRILEIYEWGEQDGCFFVAMEYFPGRTLAEILSEGRLNPARAARYTAEICRQLR